MRNRYYISNGERAVVRISATTCTKAIRLFLQHQLKRCLPVSERLYVSCVSPTDSAYGIWLTVRPLLNEWRPGYFMMIQDFPVLPEPPWFRPTPAALKIPMRAFLQPPRTSRALPQRDFAPAVAEVDEDAATTFRLRYPPKRQPVRTPQAQRKPYKLPNVMLGGLWLEPEDAEQHAHNRDVFMERLREVRRQRPGPEMPDVPYDFENKFMQLAVD